ncbi:MAG: 50S ribosomal protein L1 [Chloroflexi bacterium]|nr:50S ribosomal protein L1 [Chloroflexota bacterium]
MAADHGKKYRAAAAKVDATRAYGPDEAISLLKEVSYAKFDATVEVHLRLGIDVRHADQQVRSTVVLPAGTGKAVRVVVFAQGDKATEALAAGAERVGGDDLAKDIEGGFLDFDVAVATPDLMGVVGRLGRVLGPRGLMPNARTGTVTFDISRVLREIKAGRVEFRADRQGLLHVPIGKMSFDEASIKSNLKALLGAVVAAKPTGAKGTYLRTVTITSTMAPGIRIDLPAAQALGSAS